MLENGLDPGAAGFVADIEEVVYLEAHPSIARPAEDVVWFGGLPFSFPETERKPDVYTMVWLISIRITVDDVVVFDSKGKAGAYGKI